MKSKLKTSWETYSRIIWDERYNENNFMIGYQDRVAVSGRREKPLVEWDSSDIPWSRVQYFRCGDLFVWDRQEQIDLLGTDAMPKEALNVKEDKTDNYSIQNSPFNIKSILHYKNGDWQYWMEQHQSYPVSELEILTYNILSDEYKQSFIDSETRQDATISILKESKAAIIVLQEVTINFMRKLMAQEWMKEMYISDKPNVKHFDSHRTVIYSKFPFELYAYDYSSRKQFLVGNWYLNQQNFHVAGVHLSSNRADNAQKVRATQLENIVTFLKYLNDDFVIAGDFNQKNDEGLSFFKQHHLVDLWSNLHPEKDGITFDTKKNFLAEFFSMSKQSNRLDRILLRSKESNWKAKDITMIGCEEISNGIYPSDHFGLTTQLAFKKDQVKTSLLSEIQPVYQSAIVIIPPKEKWANIQMLRKKYDNKVERWMPHITLIYGFIPDSYFELAAQEIAKEITAISPFNIMLKEYGFFEHRKNVTAWLKPESEVISLLQAKLQGIFPQCKDEIKDKNGFNPHMNIGQFAEVEKAKSTLPTWKPLDFETFEIALISRNEEEPFQIQCTIELGTGKTTFLDENRATEYNRNALIEASLPAIDTENQIKRDFATSLLEQACSEELGNPIELYPLGSDKLGTKTQNSDIDLVALIPLEITKKEFLEGVQQRLVGISDSARFVLDARVPILKLSIEGIALDLMCCQNLMYPATIQKIQTSDWHKFDDSSWQALAGYFEAAYISESIQKTSVDLPLFLKFVQCIKVWTISKSIKGNSFGFLGNYSWTVFAVWICSQSSKNTTLTDLIKLFYKKLATHDWTIPVVINKEALKYKVQKNQDRMPIVTSVKPYFNSTRNITRSTFSIIREEAQKAVLITKKGPINWNALLNKIEVLKGFDQKVVFSTSIENNMEDFKGYIEGNIVGLMISLERELDVFVRPQPSYILEENSVAFNLGVILPDNISIEALDRILNKFKTKMEKSTALLIDIKY